MGGRPHKFPLNNFSSVYRIFTKLGHMIPLWKRKNPIYFGVIRSKVKVTVTINIIVYRLINYIDGRILWCTHFLLTLLKSLWERVSQRITRILQGYLCMKEINLSFDILHRSLGTSKSANLYHRTWVTRWCFLWTALQPFNCLYVNIHLQSLINSLLSLSVNPTDIKDCNCFIT
jgi:hypothetical protein